MNKRARHAASAAALAIAAVDAIADDPVPLPPVEVIGRYENEVGVWDAASQGAVTREGIEKRPLLRPGEVLEAVPGMVVTQHSGDGKANQYFLRGYNLDHGTDFATWVAGMPVNMPTHAHGQGYTDLNFLIPELISRVRLSTRDRISPRTAISPRWARRGSSTSTACPRTLASADRRLVRLRARALRRLSGARRRQPASTRSSTQHSTGPGTSPPNFNKYNGVLRYAQGTRRERLQHHRDGATARAGTRPTRFRSAPSTPAASAASARSTRPTAANSSATACRANGGSRDGDVSRAASACTRSSSRLNLFSNFTYFLDNPVNGDQFEQAESRTVLGGESQPDVVHRTGASGRSGTRSACSCAATASSRSSLVQHRGATAPVDDAPRTGCRSTSASRLLLEHDRSGRAGCAPSPACAPTSSTSTCRATTRRTPGKDAAIRSSRPSSRLIFGPWRETEYFLNSGHGFHSNDARGTTITIDPKTGEPAQSVDPLVRTVGYEGGLRSRACPGCTTSLALWRLEQDSELLFVGDAGTTEASRPSERTGVEWVLQLRAATLARVRPDRGLHARAVHRRRSGGQLHPRRAGRGRVGRA